MTFKALIQEDSAAINAELGGTITVRLAGVVVATPVGRYIPLAEVVSGYDVESVELRPVIILDEADAAGITRNHTMQPAGEPEMRIYGDPHPANAIGRVKFVMVK